MGRIEQKGFVEVPNGRAARSWLRVGRCTRGPKHQSAKPLKEFGGASVMEIVCDDQGDAYRVVYVTRFADAIYVLHAFQKKSTRGKKTPDRHLELIKSRLKEAERDHRQKS